MYELDQKLLRARFTQLAPEFDAQDFFCAESRQRMLSRLELVDLQPTRILDLGAGTGAAEEFLRARFPDAELINLDSSEAMLAQGHGHATNVCADAHNLPFSDGSFDIVISNMMLPGCAIPERVFDEARRVLRHPGLFLFTTLGPDTFKQLLRAWSLVDTAPHVHAFADMHNVGDALVQAGFREPVMDVEHLTITYGETNKLVADLRAIGATNILLERRRGLTTPRLWQRMTAKLDESRNSDGRLPISIELVTGQAWTGSPERGVQMFEGEARFPISRL